VLRSRSAKIPSIQAKKSQLKIQTSSLPTKGEAPRTPEIEGSISEREQGSRAIHQSQSRSGVAKKGVSRDGTKVPNDVEVRTAMKVLSSAQTSTPLAVGRKMPNGQTLISSSTGTLIKNGVTTVHETSVIGTTIEGQYAQFVKSTSHVFRQPSQTAIEDTMGVGSVEIVSEMPLVARDQLTPLETLFDNVDTSDKDQLYAESSSQHSSIQLEPSFQFAVRDDDISESYAQSTASTERINSFISSQQRRNDDNRWRYKPSPKPKVAILRNSGANRLRSASKRDPSEDPDPTEVITLRVQTITADGFSNWFYEVATIKSPYVMRLGAIKNTRFVTMTKSYTRRVTATEAAVLPTSVLSSANDVEFTLAPRAAVERSDEPFTPTDELPLAENILATTTPIESIFKDSSDTATLPAIIVAATESEPVSLETVTETFSTTETRQKTSILPYLRGGETSLMTLTQTYSITRIVVAVKTLPPLHLYQFIPSKTLTDVNTRLLEAGSENRHRLLEGELEFSDNEELSSSEEDDGPVEKRLPAPTDFLASDADLSSIGTDFDLSSMDKHIELQPSLVSSTDATESAHLTRTPPLNLPNFNLGQSAQANRQPLDAQVLSAEQMQQLALLRYINPYAAAGLPFGYGGLPGAMGGFGALNNVAADPAGVQSAEYGTTTPNSNPLFGQQFSVVSSPVVTEVTTTTTQLRVYRIIFRAQTTFTTVTSTSIFPTTVTSYVSSTVAVQPTHFPTGLFPPNFGYPAFG